MIPQFLDNKSKFILIPQTAPYLWTLCTISVAPRFNKEGGHCWGVGGDAPASGGMWGLRAEPPAANEFKQLRWPSGIERLSLEL